MVLSLFNGDWTIRSNSAWSKKNAVSVIAEHFGYARIGYTLQDCRASILPFFDLGASLSADDCGMQLL